MGLSGTMQQGTGEDCMMWNFMINIPARYYLGDQIKKNEMSGTCATRRRRKVRKPGRKKSLGRRKRRWENSKVDLQEVGCDMDWIDLVQYRYRWQALVCVCVCVCVIMKLRVP